MKVVLAGGSGALGSRLAPVLAAAGHEPVVLTRSLRPGGAFRQVLWDGRTVGDWASELEGAAVINLAGELVDRRPSAAGIDLHAGHRPATLPTPAALVRVGAVALRTDPALALTGRRGIPARLAADGFAFAYPTLSSALTELTRPR